MEINSVTDQVIGAAVAVHRALGPGLLEKTYEACVAYELMQRGLRFERQKKIPVVYRGKRMGCGYRADLLVEDAVIVELKAVDRLAPIHDAQVITYLKLSGYHVALLINFNVHLLKQGIRRLVLGLPEGGEGRGEGVELGNRKGRGGRSEGDKRWRSLSIRSIE